MPNGDFLHIIKFLKDYPGMSLQPSQGEDLILKGVFAFKAKPPMGFEITDSYGLEIIIPKNFPKTIPTVKEINGRIPRDGNYHINPDDTLCLGSPLRILKNIYEKPSLSGFAEGCVVPYLYAVSYKLEHGGEFYFGELDHDKKGVIDDYRVLFGLETERQVLYALHLLGMKERIANKKLCPCDCGQRLGRCTYHYKLKSYRKIAPRTWFNSELSKLTSSIA